jgi:hypothetical protein
VSAGLPPTGERAGNAGSREGTQQSIAAAIAEVSERASVLVREEIELAKAEMSEKAGKLARGAVVGVAAGVFFLTALFFVLIGCAWLLYFYLPVGDFAYFWGFFAMAAILVLLGVIAGVVATKAVKKGAPPVPNMAIAEARKIRESVGSGSGAGAGGGPGWSPPASSPTAGPVAAPPAAEPPATAGPVVESGEEG